MLYRLPLGETSTWILRWNHSVTGVTVSDYYRWDGRALVLSDSHTPAFDAGLGYIPGRGRLEPDLYGGFWIFDIDEPVADNAYWLRVGSPAVNHRLVHAGQSYSLSEVAAGRRVRVAVRSPCGSSF